MPTVTPETKALIEREIYRHFLSHTGSEITPAEWKGCVIQVVSDLIGEELKAQKLEEEVARLQLDLANTKTNAQKDAVAAVKASLIDTFTMLSESDDPDAAVFKRCTTIIERIM